MVADLVFESTALNTARAVAQEELKDLKEIAKVIRKQIEESADKQTQE